MHSISSCDDCPRSCSGENLSDEEKIAGLSRNWSEVRYNFINFDLIPDVEVWTNFEDAQKGRDAALERAIAEVLR